MNYNVKTLEIFEKQFRRLNRKYPSLKPELAKLIQTLKQKPLQGISLGNNCYKIRLGIRAKGKGKSGGTRIITHIVISETTVYLLTIYDKSEKNDLTDKELKQLLSAIPS